MIVDLEYAYNYSCKAKDRQSFLDHKDGLDDRVHLMHVGACPHDPHTDRTDNARYYCHSRCRDKY